MCCYKRPSKVFGPFQKIAGWLVADSHRWLYDIQVHAKVPAALYVTLTTAAHGRFSDNAEMIGGSKLVQFIPFGELIAGLTKTLRVEDWRSTSESSVTLFPAHL